MFSRVELEFLNEKAQVNEGYRRVIQHRINKKLETFKEDLDILSKNPKTRSWINEILSSVTKNSNNVTEYSNTSRNQEHLVLSSFIKNKTEDYSGVVVPRERFELTTIQSSAGRSPSLSYLGNLRLIFSSDI